MNKYQRAERKIILQIMAGDPFGRISYKQAKRILGRTKKVWLGMEDKPVLIMVRHHGRTQAKQQFMELSQSLFKEVRQ